MISVASPGSNKQYKQLSATVPVNPLASCPASPCHSGKSGVIKYVTFVSCHVPDGVVSGTNKQYTQLSAPVPVTALYSFLSVVAYYRPSRSSSTRNLKTFTLP
jgi:hypothetical protein